MIIPDWFKKNVQLCFEWSPTGGFLHDANQCAQLQRGLPRKLCAKIGSFTRDYLDETDLRIGGCYYRYTSTAGIKCFNVGPTNRTSHRDART